MILLNKFNHEMQVDSWLYEELKQRNELKNFRELPARIQGSGNPYHVAMLLTANGIGDDIHCMPALSNKVNEGYTIDVFGNEFRRKCFESVGCNFSPTKPPMGFMPDALYKYGAIFHLSEWCLKHDRDTSGNPFDTRFQQFADLVDTDLPKEFSWIEHLKPKTNKRLPYILFSLHATSPHRSYTLAQSLYSELRQKDHQRKNTLHSRYNIIAFGDSPNEYKAKSLEEMLSLVYSASLVIAVDTGTLALALALCRPVVALFGPTTPNPITYQFQRFVGDLKLKTLHSKVYANYPCEYPCNFASAKGYGVKGFCKHVAQCMQDITPEEVVTAIDEMLE